MKVNKELIKGFMIDNNLNIMNFCKVCNISYHNFRNLMSDQGIHLLMTLFSIAQVMNVSMFDLLEVI